MQLKQMPTVSEAFNHTARQYPSRTAQLFNEQLYHGDNNGRFTYQEMRERVERLAGGFLALGLQKGERVAIMSSNSPYWTQSDVAVANCGGVLVTIYPTLSLDEVAYIINDSESRFLLLGSLELVEKIQPNLALMPTLEKIILLDIEYTSASGNVLGMAGLMRLGEEYLRDHYSIYETRWQSLTLDDWMTILYTSGTTGQGKGVILTHWSLSSRMAGVNEYFARYGMVITEEDLTLSFLPLSHIFDRGSCQWMALWQGATIAYADNTSTILADMQKYNPTWFNCVPRLYEKIYITFQQEMSSHPMMKMLFSWALKVGKMVMAYRTDDHGRINMSPEFDLAGKLPFALKWRFFIADKMFARVRSLFGNRFRFSFSASAGIAPDLLTFYYTLGIAVLEGYGSTESCNACNLNPITACKPGYVGPPANGGTGRVAGDGEYEIGGAGIFTGYLNKPEENEAAFTADGWFRTGDLVEMDQDGYVKIIDRKKAIICLATGKNVAPQKVEALFSTSAVIEQMFVMGDERNFISALLVPNFNYFMELFEQEHIPFDRSKLIFSQATGVPICMEVGEDFIAQPRLRELIERDVVAANSKLEKFETIKKYRIIPKRFSEENGELTPTQKTKKRIIMEHYRETIEALYS
jgi:long-chain acyl-CoA synthetase